MIRRALTLTLLAFLALSAQASAYQMPARVVGRNIEVGGKTGFLPGVNLGSTVPGTQPGEVAATRADYDRWLRGMSAAHVRVVRVYTILRPSFYDALAAFDRRHRKAPILLMQGVWIPEEEFLAAQDAYAPAVTDGFRAELHDAVAVVHGDASLPLRPGHAGGRYRSDVARWTLAYSIGVEWDPHATAATDQKHAGQPPYSGRFFSSSSGSTPMESWIASMLDYTASLEAARGWSRPLTFTNWLTTDPLHHPSEPLPQEDMVSVDATHIAASAAWPGGFFASYHAYPYYPDFLRYEYGGADPYASYLHALRAYHGNQAVMITEFGVPSSLGLAHLGPAGRDQGGHSEAEAGRIDASLLRDIKAQGFAGGVAFEWIDEWFKFTWNTIDLEQPADRRQLWLNPLTNEEHFGLIAAEPRPRPAGRRIAPGLRVNSDEENVILSFDRAPKTPLKVDFDVRPGENGGADPGADVAVTLGPGRSAHLTQAAWTDANAFMYGIARNYIPVDPAAVQQGSGVWVSPRQMLNRPYTVPTTGEQRPAELADVGDISSLVSRRGRALVVRVPWSMLTFSDPSSHLVYVPHDDGTITTEQVGAMGIALVTGAGVQRTKGYDWRGWNSVRWRERRKAGFATVARAFAATARQR